REQSIRSHPVGQGQGQLQLYLKRLLDARHSLPHLRPGPMVQIAMVEQIDRRGRIMPVAVSEFGIRENEYLPRQIRQLGFPVDYATVRRRQITDKGVQLPPMKQSPRTRRANLVALSQE